jgi:hypothetical protein
MPRGLYFVVTERAEAGLSTTDNPSVGKAIAARMRPLWRDAAASVQLGTSMVNDPAALPWVSASGSESATYVLLEVPPDFNARPAFQQRGMAKAAAGLRRLLSGGPSPLLWWLSLKLTVGSGARLPELRTTVPQIDAVISASGSALVMVGGALLSSAQLERLRETLESEVSARSARNPLLEVVDTVHVMQWLGLGSSTLAVELLTRLGAARNSALEDSPLGPALRIVPVKTTSEVVAGILAQYGDEGPSRAVLSRSLPSSLHLVDQLFDAHVLVESPDAYVFTMPQLSEYMQTVWPPASSVLPGVKELKERLGLKRRKAEQLRTLLAQLHSLGVLRYLDANADA